MKIERPGMLKAIGNTPMVEVESLSRATGCKIMAKCEHLNPGGSVKDRPALWIVEDAERRGLLKKGGTLIEGSGGNTGIAVAMIAAMKGMKAILCLPDHASQEKCDMISNYGATLVKCPSVPFSHPDNYYHTATRLAYETDNSLFCN